MKQLTGIVVSTKMEKTVVVKVTRQWEHPLYKKTVKRSKNVACRIEKLKVEEGDEVVIEESRPLSKTVHYKVVRKIEKNKAK